MAATPLTLEHEFMFEWSYYLDPDTDWANMKAFIQQNFGKGAATNLDVAKGEHCCVRACVCGRVPDRECRGVCGCVKA